MVAAKPIRFANCCDIPCLIKKSEMRVLILFFKDSRVQKVEGSRCQEKRFTI